MTYANRMIRPGMTAIAAVLALSATPLLAQSADPAPVIVAPPSPVTAAPTPAPSVQTAPVASPTVATPAPVTSTTTTTEAAPATTRTATPARRTATRTTTRTAAPRAVTGPTLVSMSEPAPAATNVTPVDAAPLPAPLPVEPVAATPPAPVAEASPYGDALPVAGGLALLALAGGALALRRRKREEEFEPALETHESDPVIPAEPAMTPAYAAPAAIRPPIARPTPRHDYVPTAAGDGALPENPELYGRYVQTAYAGPTPENPSLSLHKRLKRARFFDQRARQAAAGLATPLTPEPVLATAAATPRAAMPQMARQTSWTTGGMRPAYSN